MREKTYKALHQLAWRHGFDLAQTVRAKGEWPWSIRSKANGETLAHGLYGAEVKAAILDLANALPTCQTPPNPL